jgi:tripartite-type tricarboxylate transporter receptor subunit TctC
MAPPGLDLVARLNDVLNKALAEPAFVQCLREIWPEPMPLTVAAFDDFIPHDAQRWAELVKESGAKVE